MKTAKTIMKEAEGMADEYDFYCDAERTGEISRATFFLVCAKLGVAREEAEAWLRGNYQRAGVAHLY